MTITKSFITLALTGIVLIGCKQTASESKTESTNIKQVTAVENSDAKIAKLETTSFNIEGMTCAIGCAKTIEKELSDTDGVQKATVDFDKKHALVSFDATKQTPETLVKIVEATGDGQTYKVSDVKSSGNHSMLMTSDQEKDKKESKKNSDTKTSSSVKPSCCAGKKQCSKKETM